MKIVYQDEDLMVVDDFLDFPESIRLQGITTTYGDYAGPDGQLYKRVSVQTLPEVVEKLEELSQRKVNMLGMGFRLNFEGETPNNEIHADLGWGEYAAVVYLSEPPEGMENGTAFWKHQTGPDRIRRGETEVFEAVKDDWNREDKWEQLKFVSCKYNSAIIYRSELFHSRWPFEAFGNSPEDGRLVVVAFFT